MTTAARPTFDPARGGRGKGENDLSALSKQYSSRDMPSHTKLKYRESGQNTSDDLRGRDLRQELEDKERNVREKVVKEKRSFTETPGVTSSGVSSSNDPKGIVGVGRSGGGGGHSSISSKRPRTDPSSIDDDDIVDDEDEDDDDSDEDDTAELLRELQKIKKERAEEQAKREREKNEEEERIRKENLLKGNPLLNPTDKGSFKIKKRWDDDVVFKNCAKSEPKNKEQHFINDTIRSEFHRKFMEKYVK